MPESLRYNAPTWEMPAPLRGCVLCDHGLDKLGDRVCIHPYVAGSGPAVPCDQARKAGGACGIEAEYLTIKGVAL